jgi:uncharacterized protein YcbK (DUF882 family)
MIINLDKCQDCNQEVKDFLVKLHDYFYHNDIEITSGYRSPEYNAQVGGSPTSSHIKGLAVDLRVKGVHIYHVAGMIRELFDPQRVFINIFQNYIHIDFDKDKPKGDGVYDKSNKLLWQQWRVM